MVIEQARYIFALAGGFVAVTAAVALLMGVAYKVCCAIKRTHLNARVEPRIWATSIIVSLGLFGTGFIGVVIGGR